MFKIKVRKVICALFILSISISFPANAHPGRTDKYGGHYVRTSGWGYPVGSYHYHNGGTSNDYSQTEYDKGYKAGYSKGYKNGYNEYYGEYTYYYSTQSYADGYEKGYDVGFDKGIEDKRVFRQKQLNDDYNKGYKKGSTISSPSSSKEPYYSKDAERQESYLSGYAAGVAKLLKDDYDKGYTQAIKSSTPSITGIPAYSKDSKRQQSFEQGFNYGLQKLFLNDYNLGLKIGQEQFTNPCPVYSKDSKRQSQYSDGYVKGQKISYINKYKDDLQLFSKEAYDEGYNQAFNESTINIPEKYKNHFIEYFKSINVLKGIDEIEITSLKTENNIDNEVLITSFQRGFYSNTEIDKIKKQGIIDGILFKQQATLENGQIQYDTRYRIGRITGYGTCIAAVVLISLFTYLHINRKQ